MYIPTPDNFLFQDLLYSRQSMNKHLSLTNNSSGQIWIPNIPILVSKPLTAEFGLQNDVMRYKSYSQIRIPTASISYIFLRCTRIPTHAPLLR